MERILKQRNIDRLYHFTQAENLSNIFTYGLLPRKNLEEENIYSCFNDDYRYDDCLDAVCMSIEFPNYKMFYKLRQDDPNVDWAVLRLDAQILCDFECAYCWTNAGDASMYNIPLRERMGKRAFLGLFEDRPFYPKREELNISDWYPTNPQAEVLVFGVIPVTYIQNVYFENRNTLTKYRDIISNEINAQINSTVFSYRNDWKYWKN